MNQEVDSLFKSNDEKYLLNRKNADLRVGIFYYK